MDTVESSNQCVMGTAGRGSRRISLYDNREKGR